MDKIDITSLEIPQLEEILMSIGQKKFRAQQIFEWVNKKNVNSFEQMTNLSLELRKILDEKFFLPHVKILKKLICDDGTIKFLLQLHDGNIIEFVLMQYSYGNTVCVSTQVGCRMNCQFCASKTHGLKRNLSAGEIASQVYLANKIAPVSNIVLMGSGEPLDNYENVLKFIRIINSPFGINIGQRHITLSTCGLVEKIYKLAAENLQITLAISLHAPNDSLRKKIMPIANKYSINDIIKTCDFYFKKTRRRITFEYVLIKNFNDSPQNAIELANLINSRFHVNLIALNESNNFKKSSGHYEFQKILRAHNITVTFRKSLGSDINAACGQLKNSFLEGRL